MTLNRFAPSWEVIELSIGKGLLMKAISASITQSVEPVKADLGKFGDLGLVAELGLQQTMFQLTNLTLAHNFYKLREIDEGAKHAACVGPGGGADPHQEVLPFSLLPTDHKLAESDKEKLLNQSLKLKNSYR